ncbi:MAG TPA: SAM-dependent methyltransferase [Terriglobia bacterium]|nr:SAM-dependent methyltransferase [Terriglobia bacterium]
MAVETPLMPVLRQEIRAAGGKITFARFMELCLYHPQHGYYNTERVKLGRHGDFYTSAHTGPAFARLLARHFELLWRELGKPAQFDLVELGPGDGSFAAELLPWVAKRFPEFWSVFQYTAVEQSPRFRTCLQDRLAAFGDRVRVLDSLPSAGATPPLAGGRGSAAASAPKDGITGCLFANEFFDALPVHILAGRRSGWRERYVCLQREALAWSEGEPSSPELERIAARCLGNLQNDFVAEVCLAAEAWLEAISRTLRRGELLVVDYGFEAGQWQAGRFPDGSALAYRQHRAADDLLADPGEQDLTAHVNFTHLRMAGRKRGLEPLAHMTQAQFLMALGESDQFQDVFSDCATDRTRQHRARQLKTLLVPPGLGTTFQVLEFRKGM